MSSESASQLPLTLRTSRLRTVLWLGVSLIFVAAGVWVARLGLPSGYVTAGFFGLGIPIFGVQLLPGASYLRLTSEGFTCCSLFRSHHVRWCEVQEFVVIQIHSYRMVAWNMTAEHAPKGRLGAFSKAVSGYEAGLPDTYGLKAEQLAELMEHLRRLYTDQAK